MGQFVSALALAAMAVLAGACGGGNGGGGGDGGSTAGVSTTAGTTATADTSTTAGTSTTVGCLNGTVTDDIRAELVAANGLPGGEVVPGATYYGTCGLASYAVARFRAAPGATLQEQVSFQDEGSGQRFLLKQADGPWSVVRILNYEEPPSCAGLTQLPTALKTLWDNCPLG